jgi:hypothetical protein
MKKAIFVIIVLIIFMGLKCTSVQNQEKWTTISLDFYSGPLSPLYQYYFTISISNDLKGHFKYSFPMDELEAYSYDFTITNEQIIKLNDAIAKSKMMEMTIPSLSEKYKPVGGSTIKAKIIIVNPDPNFDQPPKVFESPLYPLEKYQKDLNELYDLIKSYVPKDKLNESEKKRNEYIEKNK